MQSTSGRGINLYLKYYELDLSRLSIVIDTNMSISSLCLNLMSISDSITNDFASPFLPSMTNSDSYHTQYLLVDKTAETSVLQDWNSENERAATTLASVLAPFFPTQANASNDVTVCVWSSHAALHIHCLQSCVSWRKFLTLAICHFKSSNSSVAHTFLVIEMF